MRRFSVRFTPRVAGLGYGAAISRPPSWNHGGGYGSAAMKVLAYTFQSRLHGLYEAE